MMFGIFSCACLAKVSFSEGIFDSEFHMKDLTYQSKLFCAEV